MIADIGVIGLAVMGKNIVLNLNDNKIKVVVFNRTLEKMHTFLANEAKNTNIIGSNSLEEMICKLKKPRKILLMIKAGTNIDMILNKISKLLDPNDIIIDGGNSFYLDSINRANKLKKNNIYYIDMGISGGEKGARIGPSIMIGGNINAWNQIKNIFQKISSKNKYNEICCQWLGDSGSGHFIKMIHNGIEYADMQIICEVYNILKKIFKQSNDQISEIFKNWNTTELKSYLIEITSNILKFKDKNNTYVIDEILDVAQQKGTGKWIGIESINMNIPVNMIIESVLARFMSGLKTHRIKAHNIFKKNNIKNNILQINDNIIEHIKNTLLFAKIISYTQGYMMMQHTSKIFKWNLHLDKIATIWQEGCIIRSDLLHQINVAFKKNKLLENLLFDEYFENIIKNSINSIRYISNICIQNEVGIPCLLSSISFFDTFTSNNLPANLLQAQRDYFGSHKYQNIHNINKLVHTNWE